MDVPPTRFGRADPDLPKPSDEHELPRICTIFNIIFEAWDLGSNDNKVPSLTSAAHAGTRRVDNLVEDEKVEARTVVKH